MKVTVLDNKTGKEKVMAPRYARIFEAMGRGRYSTRDMVAAASAPPGLVPAPAASPAPAHAGVQNAPVATTAPAPANGKYLIKADSAEIVLDEMDASALHELAKRLGVKVHHASGAEKVRAALIEAKGAAAE